MRSRRRGTRQSVTWGGIGMYSGLNSDNIEKHKPDYDPLL